jgi:cell wall-associated NlpC family hydrolase
MTPKDFLRSDYLRAMAVDYGRAFLGVPYRWGGDSPMEGFDCSGFVVEILQGVGILPHGHDYSAHDLYTIFKSNTVFLGYQGCLAFWFNSERTANHVMILLDNEHVLGTIGGGSKTITAADAVRDNAFLAVRPLSYRKPQVPIIVDPFKEGV